MRSLWSNSCPLLNPCKLHKVLRGPLGKHVPVVNSLHEPYHIGPPQKHKRTYILHRICGLLTPKPHSGQSMVHRYEKRRLGAKAGALTIVEAERYADQLGQKIACVQQLFSGFELPDMEVFESKQEHYRMRAEFRLWQDGEDIYYIMFDKVKPEDKEHAKHAWNKLRVDSFPVASELVNELMQALLSELKREAPAKSALRHRVFQANFHTTLAGDAMVTLCYHKKLTDEWTAAAEKLRAVLSAVPSSRRGPVTVIGRSRGQKITLGHDFVTEEMHVDGRTFQYKQVEGAFSQPNGMMCQHMLTWARDVTEGSPGDLLELYCGNGNFTVALADNFRQVVATEVAKASVAAASENLQANSIQNVKLLRLSSQEFTQAWRGTREFFRLKGFSLVDLKFQTILVDPPRSGLDDETVKLLQEFENVVYISCNPESLHNNLQAIAETHTIERFAIFDQFPYTDHIECGVYLQRRQPEAD